VLVGHGDPAIFRLVVHFKKVIQEIIEGNFRQLPPTREITKELARNKKKGYFFTAADCANLWKTVDAGVETKWLGARNISAKVKQLKNKVICIYILMTCR